MNAVDLEKVRLEHELRAHERIMDTLMDAWMDLDAVRDQYALLSARQAYKEARGEDQHEGDLPGTPGRRHLHLVRDE